MKNKNLNLLTVCSGIGAPEVAAMRVYDSVEIVAACEIDKFARESYLANFEIDEEHFHKDITTMDATPYRGKVDLLVGGFPCQAFSFAGKRLGFEDTRGTIFYDCVRVVKECEPDVFIFENVKGLVGHDKPKDQVEERCTFDLFGGKVIEKTVKKAPKYYSSVHPKREIGRTLHVMEGVLNEIGYFWTWEVLNTKDFGVPQKRERIFMVGFKDEEAFKNFSFPMPFPLEKRLKDVLEDDVDERYYLSEKMVKGFMAHKERHQKAGNGFAFAPTNGGGVASCLSTKEGNRATDNFILGGYPKDTQVAGLLDIKGTEQIRRVHEVGGGSTKFNDYARWTPRTKDNSKGFP